MKTVEETKSALIIVDFQNDYFPDGKMQLVNCLDAAIKTQKLLEYFRSRKLPIVHVQHISQKPTATFFLPNTEGVKIHHTVSPLEGEVVVQKNYPNSFRNTKLLELLKQNGTEQLVFAGAMTHMCIDATVRAAFDYNFSCTVISDCCATRDLNFENITITAEKVQAAFLSALSAVYARVLKLEDFINLQ